jgi:hypothetical protein
MADIGQDYIDFLGQKLVTATPNDGASGYAAPASGEYEFEIKEVILGQTKKGDKMMLTVQFEVASEGTEKGKQCRGWYVLDPENDFHIERLKSLLDAAGVAIDANGGFSKNSLVGAHLLATIENQERSDGMNSEGKETVKVFTRLNRERPLAVASKVVPPQMRKGAQNGPAARR